MTTEHDKPMIMVVDDDPPVRSLLCDLFEDAGYHVLSANGGAAALRALDIVKPALMTLDWEMPGMNGGQVLAALQRRLGQSAPAVVVISSQESIFHLAREHAQAVVAKPFEITAVLDAVERLLAAQIVGSTPA